jgi:hypothetical protein
MLYQSTPELVKTRMSAQDAARLDVLASVISWRYDATTMSVKFNWSGQKGHYYIVWAKNETFTRDVHRSKRIVVPPDTPEGAVISYTVLGFTPQSNWYFKLVSNFMEIRGEQ